MNQLITTENSSDILKEIEEAFFDIPFENSQFQTERFVINAQLTPERAYRAIGLRMTNRLRALREAQFARMREDVDIDEMRYKLETEPDPFERRRLHINIEEKLCARAFTDKLINDALAELNVLYHHFQRLPRFTRQQFEAAEASYFEQSLTRQLHGMVGAAESLANMSEDYPALCPPNKKDLKNVD